jgi:hypothetical protein
MLRSVPSANSISFWFVSTMMSSELRKPPVAVSRVATPRLRNACSFSTSVRVTALFAVSSWSFDA